MKKQNTCPICNNELEENWYIICHSCFKNINGKIENEFVPIQYRARKGQEYVSEWQVNTRKGWERLTKECKVEPDPAFIKKNNGRIITENEERFLQVIEDALKDVFEDGFRIYPQVALFSIVDKNKTEEEHHSELFRSVDFLVTSSKFEPLLVIEINDRTHENGSRQERDRRLKAICEEALIPVIFINGRYGSKEVTPEELSREIQGALWDISNNAKRFPTYFYKIIKPDKAETSCPSVQDAPHEICGLENSGARSESELETKGEKEPLQRGTSKAKNKQHSKKETHQYRDDFFVILLLGLVGYLLGVIIYAVLFPWDTVEEILLMATIFTGSPFGWTIVKEFWSDGFIIRAILSVLVGVFAYPIALMYYFIRTIVEIIKNLKETKRRQS